MNISKLQATNPSNKTLPKYVMVERLVEMAMFFKDMASFSERDNNAESKSFNKGSKALAIQMLSEICFDDKSMVGMYDVEFSVNRIISKYSYNDGNVEQCTNEICDKFLGGIR